MLSDKAKRLRDNPINLAITPDKAREVFGEHSAEWHQYALRWGGVNEHPKAKDRVSAWKTAYSEATICFQSMSSVQIAYTVQQAFSDLEIWIQLKEFLADDSLVEIPHECKPFVHAIMRGDAPPKKATVDIRNRSIGRLLRILEQDYDLRPTRDKSKGKSGFSGADIVADAFGMTHQTVMNIQSSQNDEVIL